MSDDHNSQIQELIARFGDLNYAVRSNAAFTLGLLSQLAQINQNSIELLQATQPLIHALSDPDILVRSSAASALVQIIENIANLQYSQELVLEIKGILNSKELIQLALTDRKLYSQLFNACNSILRECQIQMDGIRVEPPRIFVRNNTGTIMPRGKSHV